MEKDNEILSVMEVAELKRRNLRETLKQIQERSSSAISLSLQWKDVDEHYQTTRRLLDDRFEELKAREKELESREKKLESREKELESVLEMIRERVEELEWKKSKFLLLEDRVKERFGEVETKEVEVGVRLCEIEKNENDAKERLKKVEAKEKEVNLEKEKVEERFKEVELREKEFGESLRRLPHKKRVKDQDFIQKPEAEEKKLKCKLQTEYSPEVLAKCIPQLENHVAVATTTIHYMQPLNWQPPVPTQVDVTKTNKLEKEYKGPSKNENRKKRLRQDEGPSNLQYYETCAKCGKRHLGICRLRTGECYNCGKLGHRKKDCPELKKPE